MIVIFNGEVIARIWSFLSGLVSLMTPEEITAITVVATFLLGIYNIYIKDRPRVIVSHEVINESHKLIFHNIGGSYAKDLKVKFNEAIKTELSKINEINFKDTSKRMRALESTNLTLAPGQKVIFDICHHIGTGQLKSEMKVSCKYRCPWLPFFIKYKDSGIFNLKNYNIWMNVLDTSETHYLKSITKELAVANKNTGSISKNLNLENKKRTNYMRRDSDKQAKHERPKSNHRK